MHYLSSSFKNALFLFCFVLSQYSQAQPYLDVPLIAQKNKQWCWAASMEMIMTYHDPGITGDVQCDLVTDFARFEHHTNYYGPIPASKLANICNNYCLPIDNSSSNPYADRSIPTPRRGSLVNVQYIDLIFSANGYSSMEDVNTPAISRADLEAELTACRPFMITLNRLNTGNQELYNHAVVAKGYYDYLSTPYVVTNDPLTSTKCEACEVLYIGSIFSDDPNKLYSALEVVRFIQPNTISPCAPCDRRTTTNVDLIDALENPANAQVFSQITSTSLSNGNLNTILQHQIGGNSTYYETPLQYGFVDWNSITWVNHNVKVVVGEGTNDTLAFYMVQEDVGTDWQIRRILQRSCTPFSRSYGFRYADSDPEDSVDPPVDTVLTNGQVTVVEFLPDFRQFYRTTIGRTTYLSPVQYDSSLPYQVGVLYKEKAVIRRLKCHARKEKKWLQRFQREFEKISGKPRFSYKGRKNNK